MIAAIVSGTLWRAPETRTSKSGKNFISAILKVRGGENSQLVKIVAFSSAPQAALENLREGDVISSQGLLKVEIFSGGGAPRLSMSMIAEQILPLLPPPKLTRQERLTGEWTGNSDGPNDSLPDWGRR